MDLIVVKSIMKYIKLAGKEFENTDHMRPLSYRFRQLLQDDTLDEKSKECFAVGCYLSESIEMVSIELIQATYNLLEYVSKGHICEEGMKSHLDTLKNILEKSEKHLGQNDFDPFIL